MSSLPPSAVMGMHRFDTDDAFLNTEVNVNTDKLDTIPPTICTSSTRPATNLYTGRLIWETDTLRMYMWNGAAWQLINDLKEWEAFPVAPVWGSSGTQPVLGNGTISGRQKVIGKTCHYLIQMTIGSTSTGGTGVYSWTLPYNTRVTVVGTPCGSAGLFDTSAGLIYAGIPVAVGANAVGIIDVGAGANARWGLAAPVALASGDVFSIGGTYEIV